MFKAHGHGGIHLKPAKTKLFQDKVHYLGHTLSKDSIQMQEEYIARILDWLAPTTPKELLVLLGFIGYYCALITEYRTMG